jgi:outer membrane biosynthesis protein TonB
VLPEPEQSAPTEEPTAAPEQDPVPSIPPAPEPVVPADEPDDADISAAPPVPASPGPLTTTAPYTLRGAFVWGPLLLLSVLALRMRYPWRRRRIRPSSELY